jgi:hypothetical protein
MQISIADHQEPTDDTQIPDLPMGHGSVWFLRCNMGAHFEHTGLYIAGLNKHRKATPSDCLITSFILEYQVKYAHDQLNHCGYVGEPTGWENNNNH